MLIAVLWIVSLVAGGFIGDMKGRGLAGGLLGLAFGPFGVLCACLLPSKRIDEIAKSLNGLAILLNQLLEQPELVEKRPPMPSAYDGAAENPVDHLERVRGAVKQRR